MKKEYLQEIIQLRHELHKFPELSLRESQTKLILMTFIQDHTDLAITDMGKWFYCEKHPSQNTAASPVAFRADMDALPIRENMTIPYCSQHPGCSHKCGHDGHSAALAGFALTLNDADVSRPVFLIFQHAEEIGAGGRECSSLIPEKHISEVYAFHNLSGYPEGAIVIRRGLTQPASKGLTFHFTGKESHASNPEEGNNPSEVIADLITFIYKSLKVPAKGMLLCTVINVRIGNKDFGVSPGEGEVSCTLRAENESELEVFESRLRSRAQSLAERNELKLNISESDFFPETRNNTNCLEKVIACAKENGREIICMKDLWRASEDFGWYLKKCPGAIFYIGNGVNYAPLHTAAYDFNDRNLEVAVDMFSSLVKFPSLW